MKHFRLKMILTESEEIGENIRKGGNIIAENADVESEGTLIDHFDRANGNLMSKQEIEQPEVVDVSDDEEVDEMLGDSEAQEEVRQFLIA